MSLSNPNFAVEAKHSLSLNDCENAIQLCRIGLEYFPDYISAYKIYIDALLKNSQFDEAVEVYQKAIRRFPFCSDLLEYDYKVKSRPKPSSDSSGVEFSGFEKDFLVARQTDLSLKEMGEMMSDFTSTNEYDTNDPHDTSSEIIAKILVEQEQYEEAIKTYENLSGIYPERFSEFKKIIRSLKKKL